MTLLSELQGNGKSELVVCVNQLEGFLVHLQLSIVSFFVRQEEFVEIKWMILQHDIYFLKYFILKSFEFLSYVLSTFYCIMLNQN